MAARLAYALLKRAEDQGGLSSSEGTTTSGPFDGMQSDDDYGNDDYDGYDNWWWSPTGMAVRYTIIVVIFAAVLLFFLGGYYHAQRRMRKGLPPMSYHAWMVRRAYRQPQPYYQHQQAQQYGYAMNGYQAAPPPPAYDHSLPPPPAYQPPEGASKVLADQQGYAQAQRVENQGESSAMMTPPAAAVRQ